MSSALFSNMIYFIYINLKYWKKIYGSVACDFKFLSDVLNTHLHTELLQGQGFRASCVMKSTGNLLNVHPNQNVIATIVTIDLLSPLLQLDHANSSIFQGIFYFAEEQWIFSLLCQFSIASGALITHVNEQIWGDVGVEFSVMQSFPCSCLERSLDILPSTFHVPYRSLTGIRIFPK